MTIYATMAKHRPDFFIHSGDTIYADGPIAAEVKLPDGEHLAEHHDRREGEGRRDARRVPRQLQIQSPRPPSARLQRRGAHAGAVGRPRGHQQLVPREVPRCRQALHREGRAAPRRPGGAGLSRIHAHRGDAPGGGPRLPQGRLRAAARRVLHRHAQLPGAEHRQRPGRGRARDRLPGRASSSPGSSAGCTIRGRPGRSSRPTCRSA